MRPITRFSLVQHQGPPHAWPSRTRLLRDGVDTSRTVPGVRLLDQFALPAGRCLLVTDHLCAWEEETEVLLLDDRLDLLARSRFGFPWGFFDCQAVTLVDERTIELTFHERAPWRVTVLDEKPWWFGSLLRAQRQGPEWP